MAAPVQRPAPDGPSDRLERGWASRGAERDAHPPVSFAHHPRPEHVAEKVEPKTRVIVASALILAVDDFRLLGMQRQSAVSKSSLKRRPQRRRLGLRTTVADRVIGVALERNVREVPGHPHVERIVEEEIGQKGADHPALWRPLLSTDENSRPASAAAP